MTIRMDEGAAELLDTLHRAGYAAYVVGGCVRDSLLGLTPHDWDLCTSALPQQVMELFGAQRCIPTGLQHGTEHGEQRGLHQQEHRVRHDGDDDDRHQLCQAPDGDPQARHTPAPNVLDTHGDTTYQAGKVCKVGHDIRYSEVTD